MFSGTTRLVFLCSRICLWLDLFCFNSINCLFCFNFCYVSAIVLHIVHIFYWSKVAAHKKSKTLTTILYASFECKPGWILLNSRKCISLFASIYSNCTVTLTLTRTISVEILHRSWLTHVNLIQYSFYISYYQVD